MLFFPFPWNLRSFLSISKKALEKPWQLLICLEIWDFGLPFPRKPLLVSIDRFSLTSPILAALRYLLTLSIFCFFLLGTEAANLFDGNLTYYEWKIKDHIRRYVVFFYVSVCPLFVDTNQQNCFNYHFEITRYTT